MSEPLVVVGNGMAATRFVDELMRLALGRYSVIVEGQGSDVITLEDHGAQSYKKLVTRRDKLTGAVLFGDTVDGPWYLDLIRSGANISQLRDMLAFGPALALQRAA